ncbi:MAG: RluA family pseudouridine synthase [Fibrobacteres bacterium]|nr:RluA family pseudouridine synthase [Fibrobacterota bacterium]
MLAEFQIGRDDAGQRAERYLRRRFASMGLDRLHSLFRRDEVKLARKPIPRSHLLQAGDVVQVYGLKAEEVESVSGAKISGAGSKELARPAATVAAAAAPKRRFAIPILHEDADLLVLDKPAGKAVHPGTGVAPGESVIEEARAYLDSGWSSADLFQPSLVHRLDKDTSGVLVIAKTGECLRRLNAALRDGGFHKRYLALVEGVPDPPQGEISGLLNRVDSRSGGAKAKVSQDEGKWSVTRYRMVKDLGKFSLLGVIIETGRMHQIRAHLAELGHPLLGDHRYGSFERNRAYRKSLGLKRTFLHASDLEIDAGDGKRLSFHAPLPRDLTQALELLPEFHPADGE